MKWANIGIEKGYIHSKERDENGNSSRVVNIGDYAQLLAIDNLYAYMGIREEDIVRIEYYDLFDYDGDYVILPINFIYFNPYYGERELVLSPKIIPVFLGIHCINMDFSDRELKYISKYEPIGCRDELTMNNLRSVGIEAYLYGCITSTLPRREEGAYQEIYLVDIPQTLEPYMPQEIKDKGMHLSQQFYGNMENYLVKENCESIREYMGKRLALYKSTAKLVVTSRLHCAVPCMAMGIPVVFVCENYSSSFAWVEKYIPVYTKGEFDKIDWNPQSVEYEEMKKAILQSASKKLLQAKEKYEVDCKISAFLESRNKREYRSVYVERVEKFVSAEWSDKANIKYGIWGITQQASEVYNWITQNYPNAELVMVVDEFRDLEFKGIKSVRSEEIEKNKDVYFFATGNSASIAAQKKFRQIDNEDKLCTVYGKLYKDI